jgi:hypothetical protein
MPQNFPVQSASLHDVEVWESLPEDVRASILRLHRIGYFGAMPLAKNTLYSAYTLGYQHGESDIPEYSFEQVLSRYFHDSSRHTL